MPSLLSIFAAALFASAAGHAQGLEISPRASQQGPVSAMQADEQGALNFELQGQHWQVRPWPKALPQKLGAQQVQTSLVHHPAGPMMTLWLTQPGQAAPWLELVSSGAAGRQLSPGWTLQAIAAQGVTVADAQQRLHALAPGQSLQLSGKHCQQLTLLSVNMPVPSAGIATEREPRADWYLQSCQAQKSS